MSTRDIVLAVKKGDRVVYVANDGVEYNAVALDIAHFGFNQAIRAHGAFLNLAYFDALGNPVKVSAAALLGSEVDEEHVGMSAYEAAKRDVRYHGSSADDKEELVHEHAERINANPRTIGWRPGSVEDKVYVPANPARFDDVLAAQEAFMQQKTLVPSVPIPAAPSELERSYEATQPDLDAANAQSKLEAMAAEGNGGAQVTVEVLPSAADLDAVAAEHEAARQTSMDGNSALEPWQVEQAAQFKTDDKVQFTPESGNDTTPVYTIAGGTFGEGEKAQYFWMLDEMGGLFLGSNLVLASTKHPAEPPAETSAPQNDSADTAA